MRAANKVQPLSSLRQTITGRESGLAYQEVPLPDQAPQRHGVIDRILADADAAGPAADIAAAALKNAPVEEIEQRDPQAVLAMLRALMRFGDEKPSGAPAVRLFNPDPGSDGYATQHTVLEIVNDDMPFLVDSVTGALNRNDIRVHLVLHPILEVFRAEDGRIEDLRPRRDGTPPGAARESFIHIEIDRITAADAMQQLRLEVETTLGDVRAAVGDWPAMLSRVDSAVAETKASAVPTGEESRLEAVALLRRMKDDLFTFLGYREYALAEPMTVADDPDGVDAPAQAANEQRLETGGLEVVSGAGLGVLRDDAFHVFDGLRHLDIQESGARAFIRVPEVLLLTKSSRIATVHRPVLMDAIGVRRFNNQGQVVGLRLFVGLFTSVAYQVTPDQIPYLRRKVAYVIESAGFSTADHAGKALTHILNSYPRDELFQIDRHTLYEHAMGILNLQERQRVALFLRRDPLERFVSALVFVPRERYDSTVRRRLQAVLEDGLNARSSVHYTTLDDSPLARVLYVLRTGRDAPPAMDPDELEGAVRDAARAWVDKLQDALIAAHGEERGVHIFHRYRDAFPASYQERFWASEAVDDIAFIEEMVGCGEIGINLYRRTGADACDCRLKLYSCEGQIRLSAIMPILNDFGFNVFAEVPTPVFAGVKSPYWVHDLEATIPGLSIEHFDKIKPLFEEALRRCWLGQTESDGVNQLVIAARLNWREAVLVRAYVRYMKQARFPFDQGYVESTLVKHAAIVADALALFRLRHDPEAQHEHGAGEARRLMQAINAAIEAIASIDEDRLMRGFFGLMQHTLRTNYFQKDSGNHPKPYVAIKVDSKQIHELPEPRPHKEIFVYSPRMEGIHLRGGQIARGGIRWSDRHQDFRTEILGLMKAQMVKNAIIVPVGAKGGFVVKQPPAGGDRQALQQEGIACYKTLIRGLLDVTDNLVGTGEDQRTVPPAQVVRHDGDDPYLVVAADKGTASFSDIANGLSQEYGFWLDDAFASGGSKGYDHKQMGITARGAWESVKRHFRELGKNIQEEPFTAIGVGDMSGDVFGNGMLLSRQTRLLGAFNHLHIFLDPDPDPETSFAERERLFAQGGGSWDSYDESKLSKGGRIYNRSDKKLELTPEIQELLDVHRESLSPPELIRAMLRSEVELLWFGGIGTYVKAARESHADVMDKANDALRVNGYDLKAKVVGEGANLGVTQAGRIEFALRGGCINTDFIDNSGGVDSSDHEVNIKVLLSTAIADAALPAGQRDALLAEMTEDVSRLVLRHNYTQTQALSVMASLGAGALEGQARLIRTLEEEGRITRDLDDLPSDDELRQRLTSRQPLTRPELATLLSHAKNRAFADLLASDLPDSDALASLLYGYFPPQLRERFESVIGKHRLRREIVATIAANQLMDRVRPTFVAETLARTGAGMADVTRAFFITSAVFDLPNIWHGIEALDNKVPAKLQLHLFNRTAELLERQIPWFLLEADQPLHIGAAIDSFRPGVAALCEQVRDLLPAARRAEFDSEKQDLVERGVPDALAHRLAGIRPLFAATDMIRIGHSCAVKTVESARGYYAVGERFGLAALRAQMREFALDSYWDREAAAALIEEMYVHQARITQRILEETPPGFIIDRMNSWMGDRAGIIERIEGLLREVDRSAANKLSVLTLVNRNLRVLVTG